jgi:hypothetical protein
MLGVMSLLMYLAAWLLKRNNGIRVRTVPRSLLTPSASRAVSESFDNVRNGTTSNAGPKPPVFTAGTDSILESASAQIEKKGTDLFFL